MGSTRSYWNTFTVVTVLCHFLTMHSVRSEVQGKFGGWVELECTFPAPDQAAVSSASLHVVEWVRKGLEIPVLIKFGSYAPRVHPQYEGRVSLLRITTLRLERLQLDDQGLYECRILLLDKSTDEVRNSTWTLLSVSAPPTFTETPPPVLEALVGSHLSLACVANGNPSPTITWLKDGNVIQSANDQGGVLSLPAASSQTAGLYTCHASNSEGNVTCVTKVKIKGPPVIVIPPKSTFLNMSQNAHLQCQAVADPPNMTYVWLKGGENVYHVESLKSRVKIMVDGTLLISSLIPEDSGNYTCVPTNGLLTPPAASAILTVMHPAQALQMPQETYLPTGMDGVVHCLVAAQPPLLRVDWMKDGEPLDLSLYPGWTLKADGSLVMATVNEDAAGIYTCTPYNSYGSMGSSASTNVILQDPPSFSITPEKQYEQEAGRTLLIPCQGKMESTIKVTWSKVDPVRRISYSIEPNGSLLLQPLIKDHHGEWECNTSNRVASVQARTQVFVLGTSPHVATSLSVSPGVKEANISWEAGFDGGSAQTFSVWVKKISASNNEGKQDWVSFPVPSFSGTMLQVSNLSAATDYQFSILSQNKIGTGPFSEITTARTLDPPQRRYKPKPPVLLSANQGSAGVILQWSHPEAQQPPITGFVLQSRTNGEEWINLDEDISANSSEIVIPDLQKDRVYELRLLSHLGDLLSEPSPSVNVSTAAMEGSNPSTYRHLEFVPEPLLAGVLGGVGFLCLVLVLLLGSACIVSRKRHQRHRKRKDDSLPAIYKCSTSIKTSGSSSPDSLLKRSLLPAGALYPTTSSTATSSSLQTDSSSFSIENHRRHKRYTSNYNTSRLSKTTSLISPSIELISRGPDGRFMLSPYDNDNLSVDSKRNVSYDRHPGVRRSVSLYSEREDRKELPFVLCVDFPSCKPEDDLSGQKCGMAQLPHHTSSLDDHQESYDGFPDFSSLCSNGSLATMQHHDRDVTPEFPVLPHIRHGLCQPSTTASALVLQMEHERERGNLSRCLKLAQEREELEQELRRFTLERNSLREMKRMQSDTERWEDDGEELMWEYKSRTLPSSRRKGSKEISRLSQSHFSSSSVHWEDHPLVSKPALIPSRNRHRASSPPTCFMSDDYSSPAFAKQTMLQSEEAGSFLKDRLTLPHLSSRQRGHERIEAAPAGYNNSAQSAVLDIQTNDSCSEAKRQNNLSNGSHSTLSFHSREYTEGYNMTVDAAADSSILKVAFPGPTDEDSSIEMSVDEPDEPVCVLQPTRPMLHHRIASHLQHGCSLTQRGQHEAMRRSTSFDSNRVHRSLLPSEPQPWRAVGPRSNIWDIRQRSQSLDLRKHKRSAFLTPDAWIDFLSQQNCLVASSSKPDSLFSKPQRSPQRNTSKYPANSPPDIQTALHSPPLVDHLSSRSSPQRPSPNPSMAYHYEPRSSASLPVKAAKWPIAHQKEMKEAGFTDALKEVSSRLPPSSDKQDVLEVEAGGYEEMPDSGSSYSSYASSGRGSMEPGNRRLSLCHLSPTLISSPKTIEDTGARTLEKYSPQMEASQRRKPSVDENYEWDAADISSQPGDHDGQLSSLDLQKSAPCFSPPSMQRSTKAKKNCTELSWLPGNQSSCSAEPEPDAVLF
ncbi:protein turtle homolog A [Melanotaenia boesemani]|uniref:protein turtle homolog A n=1 Tax=Melanotaenia boesemani TaxID=1250792 RepID=UPI001C057803|nr:protein turtle homolog A [Melanotaenia boesemani]XP_041825275.1 protein turtle homolog A [Melanotaenia boesemani]XP_041825276.1 protein turtle homolog A [Melanotaenia boesemani]XP_041825277.1 protein turtle homolog A [Melanotaenia boesemani]XP_041825278.1 protein turtle homolog A [Melanotaenia boesemani]